MAAGWFDPEFVAKRGFRSIQGVFTVARLTTAQFASVRLCLHWLGYHKTVGGVKRGKAGQHYDRHFSYFSAHCIAIRLPSGCTCVPTSGS